MSSDFLPQEEPILSLPATFGSFLLLHQIARGGMGDVFLAKTSGTMGIEKHCVIKTLRSRYHADSEYVQRFVEEARLVVQLSHRNICQVFDVGRVGNSYYLAMELVLGHDVRTFATRVGERGSTVSRAVALHVAIEMLEALDYAHRHVDPASGQPLHIVHRDVSPQNVLINYEGEVKLIDFGLAERGRAVTTTTMSSGAVNVMGKIAYMAPEHARGEVVDARADQFAAAVVIFELLAGVRFYDKLSPREVWHIVGGGQWEPPKLKELDPPLQAILRRALAPEKSDRYATCGEFRDALQDLVRAEALPSGQRALRETMNAFFADELGAVRELLQRAARLATSPTRTVPGGDFTSFASAASTVVLHDPTEAIPRTGSLPFPVADRGRRLAAFGGALAVLVIVVAALAWAFAAPEDTPASAVAAGTSGAASPTNTGPAPTTLATSTAPGGAATAVTTSPDPAHAASTNAASTNAASTNAASTNAASANAASANAASTNEPSTATASTNAPETPPEKAPNKLRIPPRPARPPPPRGPTLGDKMARVKKCSAPCAAPLVPWAGRLGEHPDLAGFTAALNSCYRTCGGR
jgi:serine/threonine-protein kinase